MPKNVSSPLIPTAGLHDPEIQSRFLEGLETAGCFLLLDAYPLEETDALRNRIIELENAASPENPSCIYANDHLWAIWNLYELDPTLMRLAFLPGAFSLAAAFMGEPARLSRATMMKKTPGQSHLVPWHQDTAIAVDRDSNDERSRGIRDGVPHRGAPETLLHRLLTARINVDPQHADGGALKVVPGSHTWGELEKPALLKRIEESEEVIVESPAGSILFYRPLLAHASGPNERPFDPQSQRRILHNEMRPASAQPGEGFSWYQWTHQVVFQQDGVFFPNSPLAR